MMLLAQAAAQSFKIDNPIGPNNLQDLVTLVSSRLLEVVIPIAVLMYVWAGANFLIANGRADYITRGKNIFKWTTIGLLIMFIGGGFVSLIQSILNAATK